MITLTIPTIKRLYKDEEWKQISFNENYFISNKGRIKNKNNVILKPFKLNSGYLSIKLWKNNDGDKHTIHKLVYTHFKNDFNPNLDIDHIDGNKLNNCIENLHQITHKENCAKRKTPNIKIYDENNNFIGEYSSYKMAGKAISVSSETIRKGIKSIGRTKFYHKTKQKYYYLERN